MSSALAVVPIFVNAGAAVLPAVVAAAGSVLGVLLRPRQLLDFCRRRPLVVVGILAGLAGAAAGGTLLAGALTQTENPRTGDVSGQVDWGAVAMEIIRCERIAAGGGETTGGPHTRPARAFIFRDNPSRCGHDGGAAPRNLMLRWTHVASDAMVLSSPAVLGGRLFGASCLVDITGNYGGVFCLDAASGRKRWFRQAVTDPRTGQEDTLKAFFSSPALTADGKYLVIGQGLHDDADCALLCLDAETGRVHWQVKTPLHIEGSPAIWGDLAVAGAGAIEGPDGKPTGDPGFVLAVRISDGKAMWRYPVDDPESSPAIAPDGKTCYIGSGFGGMHVVALRTAGDAVLTAAGAKRLVWKTATPYPATGAVTLCENLVIIGCGRGNYVHADANPAGAVIALNRDTGAIVWETPLPDAVLGAVAAGGGKVVCPVRNGEVVALNVADGKVLWRRRVSGASPVLAGVALGGGTVYALARDGTLAVMDARSGRVIETHHVNDQGRPGEMGLSLSSPTISGGRLYVGSETGGLRCYVGTGGSK